MKSDLRMRRILNDTLSYDEFRSELCHMYKTDGNVVFLTKVLKSDMVNKLWEKKKYAYALYILSMVDYISWKNKVPFYNGFNDYEFTMLLPPPKGSGFPPMTNERILIMKDIIKKK